MKQRIITAIIMTIIFIPFFLFGGWFTTILFTVLAYIGSYELIRMYQTKNLIPDNCKYVLPLFSSLVVLFSGFSQLNDVVYVLLLELMFLLILPIFNKNIKTNDVIFFIFSIIYTGIGFSMITTIRNLDGLGNASYKQVFENFNIHIIGLILFVYVILTTMLTDVGAYQIGIKFGKHKLCPTISPKKSIEGSIAGTIIGALGGTIFMGVLIYTLPSYYAKAIRLFEINNNFLYLLVMFLISIIISIAGQLGDLIASKIKREYDIKDYGNILPGHGGILDRFDSSIYSFLVFFIILIIIGVGF